MVFPLNLRMARGIGLMFIMDDSDIERGHISHHLCILRGIWYVLMLSRATCPMDIIEINVRVQIHSCNVRVTMPRVCGPH